MKPLSDHFLRDRSFTEHVKRIYRIVTHEEVASSPLPMKPLIMKIVVEIKGKHGKQSMN